MTMSKVASTRIMDMVHLFRRLVSCLSLPVLLIACSQGHEVTTWNEWCDYEASPKIIGKEQKIVSYNLPKIRDDFVNDYNEILVEELVSHHFWDTTIHTNQAAEALINRHELGFWVTGNKLHFSNTHLSHEDFEGDIERFKTFLSNMALKDNKYQLNGFQICIYKTIDNLFEFFVIHTMKETQTIPLDFSYKNFFTKS